MTRDDLVTRAAVVSREYFMGNATATDVLRARNAVLAFDADLRQKQAEALRAKQPRVVAWPKLSNTAIRKELDRPAPPPAPHLLPTERLALRQYQAERDARRRAREAAWPVDPMTSTWMA